MLDQHLRLHCQETINSLPIPRPFDLESFRQALEHHRNRPLSFIPSRTTPECSGVWLVVQDADYIFYERDTTTLHQWHIIGHETGHMIFGHQQPLSDDDQLTRLLFPDLSPDLVRSMLQRSAYSCAEEREAETFASLLLERIASDFQPPAPEETAAALYRVEGAFGRPAALAAGPGRG
jgi:hypothetical protein